MILKIISYGLFEYIKDRMNVFDIIINLLSMIEIISLGGSKSALRVINIVLFFSL